MRNELIEVLSSIEDTTLISKILMNMSDKDLSTLMSLLEYAGEDTKSRWLDTYSKLMKY